jgi:hypothetical protein
MLLKRNKLAGALHPLIIIAQKGMEIVLHRLRETVNQDPLVGRIGSFIETRRPRGL